MNFTFMNVSGPILLIEDDAEDADLIRLAITDLGISNPVQHFAAAQEAYEFLLVAPEQPLIILCDIKMPILNGLSLLKSIITNEYLRQKSIPFVFLTGLESHTVVRDAYDLGVQGFFHKGKSFQELKDQLLSILVYWRASLHPNAKYLR